MILAKSAKQIWFQKLLPVELNDQICNSSSNFKSTGWKLTILEIQPMLTSKIIIGGWIQWPDMQILFKFQVNRMKIEDFRNTTWDVDLWPMLTFWPFDLKKNKLRPFDILYHVVKISLKLWPVGDRQTRLTNTWKIFDFASNKQTEGWKHNLFHLRWRR